MEYLIEIQFKKNKSRIGLNSGCVQYGKKCKGKYSEGKSIN
jgi:hypothetical protein